MLKSNASRVVLVILLAIAALELSVTGKFAQVWSLAFSGATSSASPGVSASSPSSSPSSSAATAGSINNPDAAAQRAHRGG